ncbi:MAG: nucleotide exchange factor GrpE [Alphaproteobacteria bacterium]|nr:nucleotide exchange factor GrpE [Alphaproteobacteria bacterium]
MTDQENAQPNDPQKQDLNRPEGEAAQDQGAPGTGETGDQVSEFDKLQAENTALKDKILRTLAEMENMRRRTDKEIADAKAYGVTSFARDMLVFTDNLRRAIESIPNEVRQGSDGPLKSIIEGIEVTERDFLSRLARHGVKKLEPQGAKFDPNLHEALFEVPNPDVVNGTVVQVVEAGFTIGDRVLRPAKVGVARGGPRAPQGE